MVAGNLAQLKYESVLANASVSSIEKRLISNKYLVVQDINGIYMGILTLSDTIKYAHKLVIDCISEKPQVDFNTSLEDLLFLMEKYDYLVLPVFKENRFYGAISYKDIIRFLYIDSLMDKNPMSGEPEAICLISAGIIHDINNILMFLSTQIELTDKDTLGKAFMEGIERINSITERYLNYLKTGTNFRSECNLKNLIKDTVSFFHKQTKYYISFNFPQDDIIVYIDPTNFTQIISNLIINSMQAMPDGGKITINLQLYVENEQQLVRIIVTDTGCGISKKNITEIFKPFFTTKQGGTGMGLPLVRYLVRQECGFINVLSEEGKGASFEIIFPLKDDYAPGGFNTSIDNREKKLK